MNESKIKKNKIENIENGFKNDVELRFVVVEVCWAPGTGARVVPCCVGMLLFGTVTFSGILPLGAKVIVVVWVVLFDEMSVEFNASWVEEGLNVELGEHILHVKGQEFWTNVKEQ